MNEKITVTFEVEEEIAVKLRVLASKENISRSEYIRRIIEQHLKKEK
jgi:predicted transcriptional regulator